MRYLICYDIPNDHRRNNLARFLLDYGERVQYSVFEFDLSEKIIDIVLKGIVEYISSEEDSVRVYRLCAECVALIRAFGPQQVRQITSTAVVV
jgi:CRISPR-associated protein Cas2